MMELDVVTLLFSKILNSTQVERSIVHNYSLSLERCDALAHAEFPSLPILRGILVSYMHFGAKPVTSLRFRPGRPP